MAGPKWLNTQNAQCTGKTAFETRADAERLTRRLGKRADPMLNVYRCLYCKKFHTGRGPKVKKGLQPC